nr:hypothetical protein CFP56_12554 [Quercus suber]
MAETSEKRKRRMAEKREADTKKQKNPTLTTPKWPLIKPKQNLQITHLKDTDLFTGKKGVCPVVSCYCYQV